MLDWRDLALVISTWPHGETSAVVEVFTGEHGRHLGVLPGGASHRVAAHLQPGTQVVVRWSARLDVHLGRFTLEPIQSRAGLLDHRGNLAALTSMCSLLHLSLPEREPHPRLFRATIETLDLLEGSGGQSLDWAVAYARWELRLLEDLGFGLDLSSCAVSGQRNNLAYVSPRTGRAVSAAAAGKWVDRLLPLPAFLVEPDARPGQSDVGNALALTAFFLERGLEPLLKGQALPEARLRLSRLLSAPQP